MTMPNMSLSVGGKKQATFSSIGHVGFNQRRKEDCLRVCQFTLDQTTSGLGTPLDLQESVMDAPSLAM